jgi:hypothetical protein
MARDSFKECLIEEGFAVENDRKYDFPGEISHGEGQIEPLGNIDETGIVISMTKSQNVGHVKQLYYSTF